MATATPPLKALADAPRLPSQPTRSLWSDAWHRLRRNHMALAGIGYLFALTVVALCAPLIAPHNPIKTDVGKAGAYRKAAWLGDPNPKRRGDWTYPLGSDSVGRDVFSRLVYGTRLSLIVGFIPMLGTLVIGALVGLMAGYIGGQVDNLLMRVTDVVYAFPSLLFFIIMQVSFKDAAVGRLLNGLVLLFVTLSILSWTGVARLVRGQVLSLKEQEFVLAARAIGATHRRIIFQHILRNTLGPLIITGAFLVPGAIITEAILSYLGIGVRPSTKLDAPFPASWGNMILEGSRAWQSQSWMLIAPCLAVALITLAFTFVGDGLRDALDPRER